ncbi:nucleotide sugar dehydrogenase [Halococcus hamelinensis]|uniref:UDP-N-acetyl-D-mannosamine dehydrogenase n=1 Tax=Halococcus hamelinensis 100A6 TaxID=1132509 RepID=M0LWY4_9EURY|nr:nucleotide sugar dehydrogenase [Halococcus hamelinensis]EMA36874.1 nucleotide sugar dehydrogenase [Halococcus hamelinensis 100A6]
MADDQLAAIDEVVVVGTGFVGLPLALMLAEHGKQVVGVDIDENLVDAINDQTLHLDEEQLQTLVESDRVNEHLEASTTPRTGDAFVVSVPTPLDEQTKTPDLTYVVSAVESILPYLEAGDLINIESTIPPLTCERTVIPLIEEAGFDVGEEIQLAHSPERILPGNVFEEIVHNDRIIGGVTEASRRRAAKIYEPFLDAETYYTDLLSAELCKLMENTFRDVNIALANEFALVGEQFDVNMNEVIELANHHPRVDILTPGIGVGGHCLPVDPWFLNDANPEQTTLITNARRINERMPRVAARKVRRAVADLTDPHILALGLTYKPDTNDMRNSAAVAVADDLDADGYSVTRHDRYVDGDSYSTLSELIEREEPDVVLQLVPHTETVAELNRMYSDLREDDVQILQFTGEDPLDPTQHD